MNHKATLLGYLETKNNMTNLNYESDSAYEYHDLEDNSSNFHSSVTSPGSHSEIVGHKPKEIDHSAMPSHKMWLKPLGLTVHDHKSLLSKTGWLGDLGSTDNYERTV